MKRVGLTFDLREEYLREGYTTEEAAEFDREETISGIEEALVQLGFEPFRIGHVRQLVQRLATGERYDLVFNISEGMYGTGREAQVPCLLDAYRIPYTFSDPLVLALTLHKGLTKRVIRDAGLNTPQFFVVQTIRDPFPGHPEFPLFVKPVAEGTGKGISGKSKVNNTAELEQICRELLPRYPEGLLVEAFLPGREFTVGITGTGSLSRCVGVMEVHYTGESSGGIYSLETKANYEHLVTYSTPEEEMAAPCRDLALQAWTLLGCRDGGRVDLRVDRFGQPAFIEVNPLAGLDPVHSDLPLLAYRNGYTYLRLIGEIMESALLRTQTHPG